VSAARPPAHPSCPSCARRSMNQPNLQFIGVLGLLGTCFSLKLPFPLQESSLPLGQAHLSPQTASRLVVFVWVIPNAMLYNAMSIGKKTTKIAPSPWDFVTLQKQNLAMAISNMNKKYGKDRACGSSDILAERQTTDTHTERRAHYNTSQPLLWLK